MNRQLDVVFVNYNAPELIYQELAKKHAAIEPPTWSLLLANACRLDGFGVAILDCDALHLTYEQAVQQIKDLNPRLVCFVVYGGNPNSGTTNMEGNVNLCQKLKEAYPYYKTCFIGSHTSALPDEVLRIRGIDYICINEGVRTLKALLSRKLNESYNIPGLGISHWNNNESVGYTICDGKDTVVPQDRLIEEIGGYAWDLLPYDKKPLDLYRAHIWHAEFDEEKRTPFAALYTSFGCQFKCDFCMINILNRESIDNGVHAGNSNFMRYFPPEFIIKEFDKLVEMGIETIRISDEMFYLNKRYYEPLLNLIIERGYGNKIRWWAYTRVNTVQEKFLDLFKRAGCNFLAIGIESANQKIRQEVTKGLFKDVDIREVVGSIRNHDINVIQNYIVGMTNDTEETVQESLDLANELNCEMMNVYPCFALPGSPLYYQAKEKGIELPKKFSEWSFLSYDSKPLSTNTLSSADVLRLRDDFWNKHMTRPEYLGMIEQRFGEVARKNIEEMSRIKLKRKLLEEVC